MNSAFNIFDKDDEDQIYLDNFRSTLLFTLRFKEDEVNKLVNIIFNIIFKNKIVLDKQDFYQIFNNLLPFDDDFNINKKTRVLGPNTEISLTIIYKQNNNDINNYNTPLALKQINNNNTQNYNYTNYNNKNINNNINTNYYQSNDRESHKRRRYRNMNEITIKVDDYMLYFGKRTTSDLFKIFVQDKFKSWTKRISSRIWKNGDFFIS